MKKRHLILFIGLLILLAMGVPAVSASTITLGSRTFTGAGETQDIDIYLDSAPNGVSGFMFDVILDNPSVAEISGQKESAWAETMRSVGLAEWFLVTPYDAYFKILAPSQIPSGSTNLYLGTVTITSKTSGKAILTIDVTSEGFQIDDSAGGVVLPDIETGIIQVGPGSISVSSTPPGGTIWLNGVDSGKVTPATLENLAPGTYKVKVTLADYEDSEENDVEVVSGITTPVAFTLNPIVIPPVYAKLLVTSTPPGAKIFLNGEDKGQVTPFTFNLDADRVSVGVWKKCYLVPQVQEVALARGETKEAAFTLEEDLADATCNFTPEFPSLLVPAVSLIGMIGAIFLVRQKKN